MNRKWPYTLIVITLLVGGAYVYNSLANRTVSDVSSVYVLSVGIVLFGIILAFAFRSLTIFQYSIVAGLLVAFVERGIKEGNTSAIALSLLCFSVPVFVVIVLKLVKYSWEVKLARSLTPIPEFRLPEGLHFYQLGMLVDGKFHGRDVLGTLLFYKLNPQAHRDEVVTRIEAAYAESRGMRRLYKELYHPLGGLSVAGQLQTLRFANPVYDNFVKQGYFRYNPLKVQIAMYALAFLLLFPCLLTARLGTPGDAGQVLLLSALLVTVVTLTLLAPFVHGFHERKERVDTIRTKLLGYRMYLEHAEKFRAGVDVQALREIGPYLVTFNIRADLVDELIRQL